jgi:probable F420-dependent oxidoreductase
MKFGMIESMCDPKHYIPMVQRLEERGWDFFYVPDSICYPKEALDDQYPYHGGREFLDGKAFLEPFSLIPALGAVTERIDFATDVLKLPIRHPTLLAKQINTVAVMTDGRFRLGAGLSPWLEDFQVTDTDWATRGPRMDEMIAILRGLMTGEYFEYHGAHYDLPAIKMAPVPEKPVPVLIGGQSKPALRRAARIGDGWISAGGTLEDVEGMLTTLRGFLKEEGRNEEGYEIHVMAPFEAYTLEGARRLRDLGATHVILSPRNPYEEPDCPLEKKLGFIDAMTDTLVTKL